MSKLDEILENDRRNKELENEWKHYSMAYNVLKSLEVSKDCIVFFERKRDEAREKYETNVKFDIAINNLKGNVNNDNSDRL